MTDRSRPATLARIHAACCEITGLTAQDLARHATLITDDVMHARANPRNPYASSEPGLTRLAAPARHTTGG